MLKFQDFQGPLQKFQDFPGLESKFTNSRTFQDLCEPCVGIKACTKMCVWEVVEVHIHHLLIIHSKHGLCAAIDQILATVAGQKIIID